MDIKILTIVFVWHLLGCTLLSQDIEKGGGSSERNMQFDREISEYILALHDSDFIDSLELTNYQLAQLRLATHDLVYARLKKIHKRNVDDLVEKYESIRSRIDESILLPHQNDAFAQYTSLKKIDNMLKFAAHPQSHSSLVRNLGLSEDQLKRLRAIREEANKEIAESLRQFRKQKDKVNAESWKKTLGVMTSKQKEILKSSHSIPLLDDEKSRR